MAAPAEKEWEDCPIPPRKDVEIEREFKRAFGLVPPSAPYFANSPWLARGIAGANYRARQLVHLEPELADLIFLAVSQDNSCRFCYAVQRSLLRILGFDEARIRSVEEAASNTESRPRERRALDFARRLSRANPAPGVADREELREVGFSDDAIREIAHVAAYTVLANRSTTLLAIPTDEAEAFLDRFAIRLFRPFVAKLIRSRSRRGEPEALPAALHSVPFAHAPLALGDLPAARVQANFLSGAWGATPLTTRTKALVFAVVARGLGDILSEREAKRLLAAEEMAEREVEEVLAHLASPKLDPIEAAILPFARETIRVRPIDVQRRVRKLLETLSVEQFVDLVGVIAVANATGRLSLVLCEA